MNEDFSDSSLQEIRARNKQRALQLLAKFNEEVPDEKAGLACLYKYAEECGLVKCDVCVDSRVEKITDRLIKCRRCFKKIWITAGTVFHGVRQVRPYLAALYLRENGVVFASSSFARLLGIADSSGAIITKKIGLVIEKCMTGDSYVVHSNSFAALVCRRSRETPAREHPRSELDDMQGAIQIETIDKNRLLSQSEIETTGASSSKSLALSPDEQVVFDLLSEEEAVSFDKLCILANLDAGLLASTLTILELNGLVQESYRGSFCRIAVNGMRSRANERKLHSAATGPGHIEGTAGMETSIGDHYLAIAHATIKQIHGGVSRKCLQIYGALIWCHLDRLIWGCGKLVEACLRHPPISYMHIVEYVSPVSIKLLQVA